MLNVIMLIVIMVTVVMLSAVMLSAVMLSAVMSSVIVLSVVAPTAWVYCRSSFGFSFYFWRQILARKQKGKNDEKHFRPFVSDHHPIQHFFSLRHWQRTKIS